MADPARALDDWLAVMTAVLGADPRRMEGVPVFTHIDRHDNVVLDADGVPAGLSGSAINEIVQRAVRAAGLHEQTHLTHAGRPTHPGKEPFGAHSLRAGFVTEGLERGVPAHDLMGQTHHGTVSSLLTYFKPARQPSLLATTAVLRGIQNARSKPCETQAAPRSRGRRPVARWDLGTGGRA